MRPWMTWSARTGAAALLATPLMSTPAHAEFFYRDATCTNASACSILFPVSSATVSYPRQLSCYWSQNDATQALRRVLVAHQPSGLPVGPTIALPVEREAASAMAFNVPLQPASLFAVKSGKLNVLFEWAAPVTSTIRCTYLYAR